VGLVVVSVEILRLRRSFVAAPLRMTRGGVGFSPRWRAWA
jgi:hypothetical protein